MSTFLILLSATALIVSKLALFKYLWYSYAIDLIPPKPIKTHYVSRDARKIKVPARDEYQLKLEQIKNSFMRTTLFWTMAIGEIVGYFFLFLSFHFWRFTILEINGLILLIASFVLQMLTLFNAWFKKKTNIIFRIKFQVGLIIWGGILILIAISQQVIFVNTILIVIVLSYFISVVIGIYSMLLDAIIAKQGIYNFDFNHYTRIVIFLGLIVASGLYYIFWIKV